MRSERPCKYCGFVASRMSDEDCPSNPSNQKKAPSGWLDDPEKALDRLMYLREAAVERGRCKEEYRDLREELINALQRSCNA